MYPWLCRFSKWHLQPSLHLHSICLCMCVSARGTPDFSGQRDDDKSAAFPSISLFWTNKASTGSWLLVKSILYRGDLKTQLLHEIIFSSSDRKKLLSRVMSTLPIRLIGPLIHIYASSFLWQMVVSQLTALLSEVGLNIQEAHVYSTNDSLFMDVFVVDGWETGEFWASTCLVLDCL